MNDITIEVNVTALSSLLIFTQLTMSGCLDDERGEKWRKSFDSKNNVKRNYVVDGF